MFKSVSLSGICLFGTFALFAAPQSNIDKNAPPIDPKSMDQSVKPQDNFFLYANGGWIKRTEIPPQYSRWGSFNELIEKNNDALHAIAEKAMNTHVDAKLAPDVQKVGDYYASGMDEKKIESLRAKPLENEFKSIDAIKDRYGSTAIMREPDFPPAACNCCGISNSPGIVPWPSISS